MKIVFDTNVIIDAVASRQPFCEESRRILLMVSEEKFSGYLTANSITDIFLCSTPQPAGSGSA